MKNVKLDESAEIVSESALRGSSKDIKKVSKVSKLIDAFESNFSHFSQNSHSEKLESDIESKSDVKSTLRNVVGVKKDAFDLLMSGGVNPPEFLSLNGPKGVKSPQKISWSRV